MSEWKEVTLGESGVEIIDGDRGKNYPHGNDFSDSGYCLFLNAKNVTVKGFCFEEKMFITQEKDEQLKKGRLNRGDVVLTTRGTVGNVGYFKADIPYNNLRINSGMVILRCNAHFIDSRFFQWQFRSPAIAEQILSIRTGSAQPQLPIAVMRGLTLHIPPLPEQKAIADTLSCLDDKIELNNQISKNLEAQAQAIFKSWFVDFEPFQDGEFVDSELGRIPKGWRVGTLGDLGDVIGGSTPSKAREEYYTKNGVAWITPKDLSNNKSKFIEKGATDISDLGLRNSSIKVMPKGTVLFSSRAPIGYIAIAKNALTTNQGFKSIVPYLNIGKEFVYCTLVNNLQEIENRATGSTFKEVSGNIMKKVPALVPSDDAILDFSDLCNCIFNKQEMIETETQTLTALRDTLLPKLMSGELRVPLEVE